MKKLLPILFSFASLFVYFILTPSPAHAYSLDSTFGNGGIVSGPIKAGDFHQVTLASDGKALVSGYMSINGIVTASVAKYNNNGTLDTSFATNGIFTASIPSSADGGIVVQSDGKIVITGEGNSGGGNGQTIFLGRINNDGTIDSTYGVNGYVTVSLPNIQEVNLHDAIIQPDDKVIVIGYEKDTNDINHWFLARFNTDGSLDTSFGNNGIVTGIPNIGSYYAYDPVSLALQQDGKIVVSGLFSDNGGNLNAGTGRFNSNGSIDTTFGTNGFVMEDFEAYDRGEDVAIQPDGKILIMIDSRPANAFGNGVMNVIRYNADGTRDNSFGNGGVFSNAFNSADFSATAIYLQPDGKIIGGGAWAAPNTTNRDFALARINSNGTLDTTFGNNGLISEDIGGSNDNLFKIIPVNNMFLVGGIETDFGDNYVLARIDPGTLTSSQLYVTNSNDNTVSVIDPTTGNTTATIPTGVLPRGIIFNGTYVYVVNSGGSSITVIDPTNHSVVTTIPLEQQPQNQPERMALSPDNKTLYASDGTVVFVIDTATNTITRTIQDGFNDADGMVTSPDGTRLYVANSNCCDGSNGWVSVIDTSDYSLITTIPVDQNDNGIAITPDGTKLYVTNLGIADAGDTVTVIDTATNSVIKTISGVATPYNVTINNAGTRAYVAGNNFSVGGGTQSSNAFVTVLDLTTNSVITQIPVGYVSDDVAISADDSTAYSTNEFSDSLSVIDTATNTVTKTFTTGGHPFGVALIPTTNTTSPTPTPTASPTPTSTPTPTPTELPTATPTPVPTYTLLGNVYKDNNQNGVKENGEGNYQGATVTLSSGTTVIGTTTTDVNGNYSFPNLLAGTYTDTLTVPSGYTASTTTAATVAVSADTTQNFGIYSAPVVGSVSINPNPVQINTSVTANVNFTDPDPGHTHSATINWGDSGHAADFCLVTAEPNGTTPGTISCTRSGGYSAANVWPVTISVSDGFLSPTLSPVAYASVYNPVQGSVFSAGPNFTSPTGAYLANTSLSGNVTFGLNYRYSGTMPVGSRSFTMDFNAANFHFNATTVNTLIITNNFALLKGSGTLTGSSQTYTYLVTGDATANTVRIQIKDQSGTAVYDTQPGAADNAEPTLVVNNVVVK